MPSVVTLPKLYELKGWLKGLRVSPSSKNLHHDMLALVDRMIMRAEDEQKEAGKQSSTDNG